MKNVGAEYPIFFNKKDVTSATLQRLLGVIIIILSLYNPLSKRKDIT
jgi:hypothetical protein